MDAFFIAVCALVTIYFVTMAFMNFKIVKLEKGLKQVQDIVNQRHG